MNARHLNTHILVIDDNRAIHEDFRKILSTTQTASSQLDDFEATFFGGPVPAEEDVRFEIDSAFQGQDGLDLVRQSLKRNQPYPLAFVDMRMPPGWDGIETIARIWKEYPDLQVVICTAYSDYSWEEMVKRLGNTDRLVVLRKPFDNAEVLSLAKTMIERWHQSQEAKEGGRQRAEGGGQKTEE